MKLASITLSALLFSASIAQATEHCLIKLDGAVLQCYPTAGLCQNRADGMRGWKCEQR